MKIGLYIPCFNAAKHISDVLAAIKDQTLVPDEVLVVDDASQNDTIGPIARHPIRLIRHKENKGLAAARNTAIKNIDADYIAALDADCVPATSWLEKLMCRFESPRIAGVGGKLIEKFNISLFDQWREAHMKQSWETPAPDFLFGSNTVFRRKALVDIGLYNEDCRNNYEDVDICKRLKDRGYVLAYEPQAVVYHLKKDNICSLLNSYWQWHRRFYRDKGFYQNKKSFALKLQDNIGLANRYIEEDMAAGRGRLLYIDFLLALHHSLKDYEHYSFTRGISYQKYSKLSFWLSLLDLNCCYRLGAGQEVINTLLLPENSTLQNFFGLILIIGTIARDKFKEKEFIRILCRHLLLSLYEFDDDLLVEKIVNLINRHSDWSGFYKKSHLYIDKLFLKNTFGHVKKWLDRLEHDTPGLFKIIEYAAKAADEEN